MGVLTRALVGSYQAAAPGPADDFWYRPVGAASATGLTISMETALKASAVWACVSLIAESIASLPVHVYQKQERGRRQVSNHPVATVLGSRPNGRQTPFDFKAMVTAHALLSHGGYAEIVPGALGAVDRLLPLDSRWVTPEMIGDDRMRFVVQQPGKPKRTINQESMFWINGLGLDGMMGLSVSERLAVEAIGLALATERYGASFFGQGARLSGYLRMKGRLTREAAGELRDYWSSLHSGLANAHRPAVLEEGADWVPTSAENESAQYLQTREFQVEEICRWFRVPPHMVGSTVKSTSWGTGIEQMSIGFVTFTLGSWISRWEERVDHCLITAAPFYYAKLNPAALLKGDTPGRFNAYQIAAGGNAPWMTRNEIRELEDRNPLPGLDEPLAPLNMGTAGATPPPATAPPGGGTAGTALLPMLTRQVARTLVRTEIERVGKLARRYAGDADAWQAGVADFYAGHATELIERLHLPQAAALGYCGQQVVALAGGVGVMDDWEARRVDDLVALVLGGQSDV